MTFWDSVIQAPGQGGSLIQNIIPYVSVRDNVYSSVSGTSNMIFTANAALDCSIDVDGRLITGDLNFTCNTDSDCSSTWIWCGGNCNIECNGMCSKMRIYAVAGSSVVNWYCDPEIDTICFGALLLCGQSFKQNTTIIWNSVYGWYYATPVCVSNWTPLPISCSVADSTPLTCVINVDSIPESPIDAVCDHDYINCEVTLAANVPRSQVNSGMGVGLERVHCPNSAECNKCTVHCTDDSACDSVKIEGYDCNLLEITVKSNQANMTVVAPGNGGELRLFNLQTGATEDMVRVFGSRVLSVHDTKGMLIDLSECSGCAGNFFDGYFVTDYLNVSYAGSVYSLGDEIWCPNDANCHVSCQGQATCQSLRVITLEGTHDVNWICNDDVSDSCIYSTLWCVRERNWTFSEWMYDMLWYLNNTNCLDPPSEEPTPAPTSFTFSPTAAPTIPPTDAPSFSPSKPPTAFTFSPSMTPTSAPTQSPTAAPIPFYEQIGLNKHEFGVSIAASIILFLCLLILIGKCIYYYRFQR
eukprot:238347_1